MAYQVNQIVRWTCLPAARSESHASRMPSRPIPKSFVGPALMAHILCCKYGYHLPLYRQSQMFENQGIDLSGRFWPPGWVNPQSYWNDCPMPFAIKCLPRLIFMDDTTVKLLQKGQGKGRNKPKTARLWVYARDEKPWGSTSHPLPGISSPPAGGRSIPANIWKPIRALPMRMPMQGIMTLIARGG